MPAHCHSCGERLQRLVLDDHVDIFVVFDNHALQPKSDQPVLSCAAFERIWTFDASEFMPDQQHMAANLSVEGVEGGVS